jgi:recombination protein RecA
MAKSKEQKKSIAEILKELDKTYGAGSVITGNQLEKYDDVVSTGSLSLDIATGIGGIPIGKSGKIIEIYGWESSGKSTITQTIIGNYQKKNGKKCILNDGENSIDEAYSKALQIQLDDLLLIQLDDTAGEGAYNKMFALIESGEIGLAVIDSYNALQPKKLVDGDIEDQSMGLHARMLGKVVMKANDYAGKYGCTFIFIGQLREKIGVMYGDSSTTQGGNSLRFYSHMRMEVSRSTTHDNSQWEGEKGKSDKTGNLTKVNIIKNKLGKPFRKAQFNIVYGQGIDKYSEIIEVGSELGVFKKWGDTVTYNETKYKTIEFLELLKTNDEFFNSLREECLNKGINNKVVLTEKIEENESTTVSTTE